MDVRGLCLLGLLLITQIACNQSRPAAVESKFIKAGRENCENQRIPQEYLVFWKSGRVSLEKHSDDESFKDQFLMAHHDEVIGTEPHYRVQIDSLETQHQRDWGGGVNWGAASVEAEVLWGLKSSKKEVIVAVIDSGVDIQHPEIFGTVAINEAEEINGIDDDNNGYVDDRYGYDFVADSHEVRDYTGHGTHVSGVIVARHDVGSILGVAPFVKLLPIGFIGGGGGGQVIDAVNAIRYAAQRGAQVINASWGGEVCSSFLREEIAALAPQNILFVTAAGNSGNDISIMPEYPAAFVLNNMITVGAATFDEKTAGFSNYGDLVDLVAPGANILSTYPPEFDIRDGQKDGIVSLDGTSMASPFVAAAAAALWSQRPDASYAEIKAALLAGVVSGPYPVASRGQLNLRLSLEHLLRL